MFQISSDVKLQGVKITTISILATIGVFFFGWEVQDGSMLRRQFYCGKWKVSHNPFRDRRRDGHINN